MTTHRFQSKKIITMVSYFHDLGNSEAENQEENSRVKVDKNMVEQI